MNYNALPDSMKLAKRWLVWKSIPNSDPAMKPRKVPYYVSGIARHGAMDTTEDVMQFGTYEQAFAAYQSGNFDGLGFALGFDSVTGIFWQGIDLDGISQRPELQIVAAELCCMSYCETSPNSDGIHAIGQGRAFVSMGSTSDGIEAYSSGRFFTVTGRSLAASTSDFEPCDLYDYVENNLRPRRATTKPKEFNNAADVIVTTMQVKDLRSALLYMRSDDRDLWQRIGHALKTLGDVGRGLFMEWSAQSEKFDPRDAAKKWDSFKPTHTSYKKVFDEAKNQGWMNPASHTPRLDTSAIGFGSTAGVPIFDAPISHVGDVRDGTSATRPLTELGNALRLKDNFADVLRYVYETKSWIEWRDGGWVWHTSGAGVRELAAQLGVTIYKEGALFPDLKQAEHFAKFARISQSARAIDAAVAMLSDQSSIRLSQAQIDADPVLVGFDNARQVIDLRTGIVRPATASDYVTKSLAPCTIGTPAMAVRWLAFLKQIFNSDAELINWLHRWCGYLLTGKTTEQIFLFFFGLGANGKSVFAETIRHVMGDYARTVASETLAETKRSAGGASPDLADLIGCRLALSTETEDGSALAESFVKMITGGDSITTRKLYCEPVQFTPTFKLLMLGNHRPIIHGTDHGIWRRVRLVPFTRTFTEQERDPQLLDTLKAEAPHILAWMVAGCLVWQRRGLANVPASIANQTADYRAEQDVIGQFLTDCTTADRASEIDIGALYTNYRIWATNAGLRPASKVSLGRRLSERGYMQRMTNGRRLWLGIALKPFFGVTIP